MIDLPSNVIELQDEDEYVNLLVYGDSGIGKTVFAGSDDDVLFIAPEDNGTLSAKRFGSTAKKWKIHNWADIQEAYKWLASLDVIPFNWVALDSLTEMQQMCMRHILDEGVRINPARDPDLPQLQEWIPYYEKVRRMVKAFSNLQVNVIFTALQQDEENEEGDKVVLPMMQGKGTQYAKQVASFMTSFGRMNIARRKAGENEDGTPRWEEVRVIQWRGSKPKTVNLSLKEIRELIESGPTPTPQPGRVVPPQTTKPVKLNTETLELMTVGADGSEDDS
jgi:AAA domain